MENKLRVKILKQAIKRIKSRYDMEMCCAISSASNLEGHWMVTGQVMNYFQNY